MTKKELIEALKPYDDDTIIFVEGNITGVEVFLDWFKVKSEEEVLNEI